VLILGVLILLLAIYIGTSVIRTSPPSWLLAMGFVGLAMAYIGFSTGLEWVPTDGESVGFGDCTVCGATNLGVARRRGINYCRLCYANGNADAYFNGMDIQNREPERSRPQEIPSGGYAWASSKEESAPTQPQGTKEIIKERLKIHRETIVKIRCGHCHRLFEEEKGNCPNCGAPV